MPDYRDRLEQLCHKFAPASYEIYSVSMFLQSRKVARETSGIKGNILPSLDTVVGNNQELVVYRAWTHLFRESIANRQLILVDDLISWLNEYHMKYPPCGYEGVIEQVRLYIVFRAANQAKILQNHAQDLLVEIIGRLPLGSVLPYMQSTVGIDDLSDIICSVMSDDLQSVYSEEDECFEGEESGTEKDIVSACAGSKEIAEAMRRFAEDEEYVSFGQFEKKVLNHALKSRDTRSCAYMSFMMYLDELEENYRSVVSFESRFLAAGKLFVRFFRPLPPSTPVANQLLDCIGRLIARSHESGAYSPSIYEVLENMIIEMRLVLDISKASALALNRDPFSKNESFNHRRTSKITNPDIHSERIQLGKDKKILEGHTRAYNRHDFHSVPNTTLIAQVHDVWLQIDRYPDHQSFINPTEVNDHEMTSIRSGVFRIYKNHMSWVLLEDEAEDVEHVDRIASNASKGEMSSLHIDTSIYTVEEKSDSYNINSLAQDMSHTLAGGQEEAMKGRLFNPIKNSMDRSHKEVEDSLFNISLSTVRRYSYGNLDDTHTFLVLFTPDSVIKLFPFFKTEVREINKLLGDILGFKMESSNDETMYRVEHETIEEYRLKVVDEAVAANRMDWIVHTESLVVLLKAITKEGTPIRIADMERVYHSCRRNKMVIIESIKILKEIVEKAKTEEVLLKVLTLVDRLLDGDILTGDDKAVNSILDWLHYVESILDPFSSSNSLKMLLRVCKRAEGLQSQTVAPYVESFYDQSVFMLRDVFAHFKSRF